MTNLTETIEAVATTGNDEDAYDAIDTANQSVLRSTYTELGLGSTRGIRIADLRDALEIATAEFYNEFCDNDTDVADIVAAAANIHDGSHDDCPLCVAVNAANNAHDAVMPEMTVLPDAAKKPSKLTLARLNAVAAVAFGIDADLWVVDDYALNRVINGPHTLGRVFAAFGTRASTTWRSGGTGHRAAAACGWTTTVKTRGDSYTIAFRRGVPVAVDYTDAVIAA